MKFYVKTSISRKGDTHNTLGFAYKIAQNEDEIMAPDRTGNFKMRRLRHSALNC